MKKISFTLVCLILLMQSCTQENAVDSSDAPETRVASLQLDEISKIDKLLNDLKPSLENQSKKVGDFEAITFEIVRNNDTGEISIENVKAEAYLPFDNFPDTSRSYQVDCDLGGDDDWSASCGGGMSCARLVKKCLDAGGCATVCAEKNSNGNFNSVKMIYLNNLK